MPRATVLFRDELVGAAGISRESRAATNTAAAAAAHATGVNRSGLGIGMAVVRELVEAHGGSVSAASSGKNLGSEFVVTLPLIAA